MPGVGQCFSKNWISEIFALGNVDFRLKPPRDLKKRQKIIMDAGKPRWSTWEFRFYYLVFAIVIPLMFKAAFEATNESNQNYYRYSNHLEDGWLFGRKVDNSDSQYRFFRGKFFLLLILMFGHISIKKVALRVLSIEKVTFDFYFGLVFIFAAHGVNSLRVLLHLFLMYGITRILKEHGKMARTLLWVYGVGTLFFNDKYRLYPFGNVLSAASFLDSSYRGIIERWDVFYNFTLLRLLSFNLDYLSRWELLHNNQRETPTLYHDAIESKGEKDSVAGTNKQHSLLLSDWTNERSRLNAPHSINDYNLKNYLAYVTYTPLFIAGPILTFNDYLYQSRYTLPSITAKRILFYAINFLCCVLLMEFILHFLYVVAASKARAWEGNTPFQTSMIGFFNLNIIWLKLLIPWRMFRLWALMDGMDPPENMIRCVDNNYSSLAFWRAWHRSYNKWVIHYIYIPLGGSSNRILTSLTVFSFVAIWHDIELKLLLWGWMIVLFLLPEIIATNYFMKYSKRYWYRHLCALGGAINIWTMIIANLFGFCLGYDGTVKLIKDLFGTGRGLLFSLCASSALFVGVQVMFEQREHEKRHGVYVRC